jgi:hypothetical protein
MSAYVRARRMKNIGGLVGGPARGVEHYGGGCQGDRSGGERCSGQYAEAGRQQRAWAEPGHGGAPVAVAAVGQGEQPDQRSQGRDGDGRHGGTVHVRHREAGGYTPTSFRERDGNGLAGGRRQRSR